MSIKKVFFLVSFILSTNSLNAEEMLPISLVKLDSRFSHHVIVAEKSTHKVHLFKNQGGIPRYIKSYNAATGKRRGDKFEKGDLKTPEGIYLFTSFLGKKQLTDKYGEEGKIYGAGAFVTNYPNPIDRLLDKTGGGIWLHSTNDNSRVNKGLDSRGCVVIVDEDLKDISKFIELERTSIVIVQDLEFIKEKNWILLRDSIEKTISQWVKNWADENFEEYISHYSKNEFKDSFRGSYNGYKNYKRSVFNGPGQPKIEVSNLSVLKYNDYAVAHFIQKYQSNSINDTGIKTLYLKLDENYSWKIVSETWSKYNSHEQDMAFTPSMRFFED